MRHLVKSRNAAFFAAGGVLAALFLGGAAHAITDTVFRYSTPQTGYYGLSSMAFAPDSSTSADGYFSKFPDGGGSLSLQNGHTAGCFQTGVNLPHGATITEFRFWYIAHAADAVDAHLFRVRLSDGSNTTLANLNSTDASNTRKTIGTAVSANNVVNNQSFVYSVGLCIRNPSGRYSGGKITYTYIKAGD